VVVFGRKTWGRVIAKGFILGSDLDSQTSGLNYTNYERCSSTVVE
jgi:hypothetical protein